MRYVQVLLVIWGAGICLPWASAAKVDYVAKLNELMTKETGESLNAAPIYEQAFESYVAAPIPVDGKDIGRWPTELPADKQRALAAWVRSNAEALDRLRQGTRRPGYWLQYQGDMVVWDSGGDDRPTETRELFWALIFGAKLKAVEGDTTGAVEDVLAGYRLASDMRQKLFFHEQMVGISFLGSALEAAFQILERTDVKVPLLESLQDGIAQISKRYNDRIDLQAEELAALDVVQHVLGGLTEAASFSRTDEFDQAAARVSAALGVEMSAEELYRSLFTHYPAGLKDLVIKGYAHYSEIIRKTPIEWKRQGIDFDLEAEEWTGGNLLLVSLVPAVDLGSTVSFRCQVTRDALATTVALLRHENEKGQFPASLSDLVSAGYLSGLPMDPYSDGPLGYRRTADTFVLYSLGADFDADSGTPSRWGQDEQGGDQVFWPVSRD